MHETNFFVLNVRITFFLDETKYSEGQSLVFECEHCGKQFSIRLGKSKVKGS